MGVRRLDDLTFVNRVEDLPRRSVGHSHFWDRAMSRRQWFGAAAGAAGALVAGNAFRQAWAGGSSDPKPIPGGIVAGGQGYHLFVPGRTAPVEEAFPINEPSTIYDFNGAVAIHEVQGSGTGRQGGVEVPLVFDTDVRFMKGRYIGLDDRFHTGTFGFI